MSHPHSGTSISESRAGTLGHATPPPAGWGAERPQPRRQGLGSLAYPIPAHANNVLYTLGGITLFGILVLVGSGIYLTQFYHPDPTQARESIAYIITTARLGEYVRGLHFWMANLVAITLLLHLVRVFATGRHGS